MIVLDTDILSLLYANHLLVSERYDQAQDQVVTTIVTRIEILQGRFDSILKAEDGQKLVRAVEWLRQAEANLSSWKIMPLDDVAAGEFDKLRENKKLKKIGRPDLLIAAIALANRAILVTRNLKHFQQVPKLHVENWAD